MQILTSPRTHQEAELAPEKPISIGVSRPATVRYTTRSPQNNALTATQARSPLERRREAAPPGRSPVAAAPGVTAQPRADLAARHRHRQRDDTDIPLGR